MITDTLVVQWYKKHFFGGYNGRSEHVEICTSATKVFQFFESLFYYLYLTLILYLCWFLIFYFQSIVLITYYHQVFNFD